MEDGKAKYNLLLLLTAIIWGFAFIAQSVSLKYIGPFTFTGIRFGLGGAFILPVIFVTSKRNTGGKIGNKFKNAWLPGLIAGSVLFLGSFLQTLGIAYTTVGKAAFITGLYIVLVPVTGIFLKHANNVKVWLSTVIAAVGLYLLCIQGDFSIGQGDLLELAGAAVWTAHILLVDSFSKKTDPFVFAFIQALACSVFSIAAALLFEGIRLANVLQAAIPILYGGIFSVGIAFTLQVIGQRHAKASHAALIMSLEAVFACLAGWLLLNEQMILREYIGCALMLAGMLITQIPARPKKRESL